MSQIGAFVTTIRKKIPVERVFTDALSCHAFGHDASLYELIPQVVVRVNDEAEVIAVLNAAVQFSVSITFRAAGTSLSGQAITDSVLVVLGETWRAHKILDQGAAISLQAGVLGSEANLYLLAYRRKIGPDPASLNSAKIAGIAANNASGMCCGVLQNSYHTLKGLKIIFADGSILDTLDTKSVEQFRQSHALLLQALLAMRIKLLNDEVLLKMIRRKYQIKNTVGYSLNAFVDFEDPIQILAHLMIGSEGTLGFISEVTYFTVPDYPCKAAALLFFEDLRAATEAVLILKHSGAAAIELMDDMALLCAAAQLEGFAPKPLPVNIAALLIDVQADSSLELQNKIAAITHLNLDPVYRTQFVSGADYHHLWSVRKGILPLVAKMRAPGTFLLNEDVAVPLEHLADALTDLKALFLQFGFEKASVFGHARDGNLHFLLELKFESSADILRFEGFMKALADLIVGRYQGSLKAEHGTGRNVAPFVEFEWGAIAYQLMWDLKKLLDPHMILNKDVILTRNPSLHLKHLKQIPEVNSLIDACIECGFCEMVCPSKDLSLTPRQRIVALRAMQQNGVYFKDFNYRGIKTCAATGMCAEVCPVGINTGALMLQLKARRLGIFQKLWWRIVAKFQDIFLRLVSLKCSS